MRIIKAKHRHVKNSHISKTKQRKIEHRKQFKEAEGKEKMKC